MARGIVTVGGGHSWETGVVAALGGPGAPLTVVRRCADMADALAMATTGQVSAAIIAAGLRGLTGEAVQHLASFGVAVIVVRADQRAAITAERIGAVGTVPEDLTAEAMLAEIIRILGTDTVPEPAGAVSDPSLALPRHRDVTSRIHDGRAAVDPPPDLGTGPDAQPAEIRSDWVPDIGAAPLDRPGATAAGSVIAVWGPTGAPGRSTVALGIADRAAAAGRRVLLIDADVYGGVISSALGLLDESAGLAGACRLAGSGRLDTAQLADLCWSVTDRCTVLTGISRADRWPEVRPSAIPVILDIARGIADLVVIDCAALLEADEELSFDTMAPRRNGATVAAIESADAVLAVGSADPPGMERLIRALEELGETRPDVRPQIIFNRVRDTAASPSELTSALRRFTGLAPSAFLPEDRAACDLAWKRGRFLGEVAHKSRLTKALGNLTAALTT